MSSDFEYDDRARTRATTSRRRPSATWRRATGTSTPPTRSRFRYNQLDSNTDVLLSNSTSLGFGNRRTNPFSMNYEGFELPDSREHQVGHRRVELGDRQQHGQLADRRLHLAGREPFDARRRVLPVRRHPRRQQHHLHRRLATSRSRPTTSCATRRSSCRRTSPSSPASTRMTFGGSLERYESENVFFSGAQSVYVYNTLDDFYTDLNGYLANPNRTTSPVNLRRFQVRYNNIPGQEKPIQPLEVLYAGAYAQDEWSAGDNLKLTLGLRFDVPRFGDTGFANANADALTFRDENGQPVQDSTGQAAGREHPVVAARRLQLERRLGAPDAGSRRHRHLHRPPRLRLGLEPDWQHRRADRLRAARTTPSRGRSIPNPDTYKPTNVTGAPASPYELALTDPGFKFPQVWRSNIAVDRRLPWGITGHRRVPLQQGRQRRLLHQRQPARGAGQLHRRGHSPALDQHPHPLAGAERHRPQEPGRRRLVEPGVLRQQELPRRLRQVRLQLRRIEEHGRSRLGRLRFVERQPALR